LDPAEVTRLLRIEPTFCATKGERRSTSGGTFTQPTGVWLVGLGRSKEYEIEDATRALLNRLPQDPTVWSALSAKYRLEVFCGLFLEDWNRGFHLSPELIALLSARGVGLAVDIYFVGDDE
jgi:hypothetical protein